MGKKNRLERRDAVCARSRVAKAGSRSPFETGRLKTDPRFSSPSSGRAPLRIRRVRGGSASGASRGVRSVGFARGRSDRGGGIQGGGGGEGDARRSRARSCRWGGRARSRGGEAGGGGGRRGRDLDLAHGGRRGAGARGRGPSEARARARAETRWGGGGGGGARRRRRRRLARPRGRGARGTRRESHGAPTTGRESGGVLFSESIEGARIAFSGFVAKRRTCFAPAMHRSLAATTADSRLCSHSTRRLASRRRRMRLATSRLAPALPRAPPSRRAARLASPAMTRERARPTTTARAAGGAPPDPPPPDPDSRRDPRSRPRRPSRSTRDGSAPRRSTRPRTRAAAGRWR